MAFPTTRLRRLRQTERLRAMVRETRLTPENFVYPLFVCPGEGVRKEVRSMPGVYNLSIDEAVREAREAKGLGIPGVILFGLPETKDEFASEAYADDGIVQRAMRAIKVDVPEMLVIGDVCLCEYTSHGHCGIVRPTIPAQAKALMDAPADTKRRVFAMAAEKRQTTEGAEEHRVATMDSIAEAVATVMARSPEQHFEVANDATLELLARTAVSQAQAGADIIAPSDMMDGRVAAIRAALDSNGFENTPILSYAAKFASGFYGPFREAADSAPQFGDRRSYQMDGANFREAMREIEEDLYEGADMIMVKPALAYLDVIAEARRRFDVPIAAYQVSGEYAMIQAAAHNGWIDRARIVLETLTSIRRAGADIILTYFAKDAAKLLS
ncbi:MAG TPA: porphobilinogen synthase [Terriglobales bacterium]|nr:porphobilinogen synthase [Terriglobales bacterium]